MLFIFLSFLLLFDYQKMNAIFNLKIENRIKIQKKRNRERPHNCFLIHI